jgi:hypothetical protein
MSDALIRSLRLPVVKVVKTVTRAAPPGASPRRSTSFRLGDVVLSGHLAEGGSAPPLEQRASSSNGPPHRPTQTRFGFYSLNLSRRSSVRAGFGGEPAN